MRITLQIDDDLLDALNQEAEAKKMPLAELVNRTLRDRTSFPNSSRSSTAPASELPSCRLGTARVPIVKALALAAELEDEETLRKLVERE